MVPVVIKDRDGSVEALISQAVTSNSPVETLERLFDLRAKVKAEAAKEAFVEALGSFQMACPVIKKTRRVLEKNSTKVRYQFAPLDGITDQIKVPMRDNHLSYSWDTKHVDGNMEVTCKITHKLGHSETSMMEIPIDKEGYMTAPQKVASAVTFAKRYTLLNALGITTADEDTDAVDVGKERDAKSDKSKIIFLLKRLGRDASTKELIEEDIKRSTGLVLEEANYKKIVAALETLVRDESGI